MPGTLAFWQPTAEPDPEQRSRFTQLCELTTYGESVDDWEPLTGDDVQRVRDTAIVEYFYDRADHSIYCRRDSTEGTKWSWCDPTREN